MTRKVLTNWTLFALGVVAVCVAILVLGNSVAANASFSADAASTYNSKCATCHGRDGRSKTLRGRHTHARDLSNGEWQNDVSDERIFNSISNGKGKMPAFKKKLSESQIDELVNYVRRLRR